ncbi:PPE36 domain protein [Mycobacterium kansasii]|uniref:PPE36 domain protein n=1 Tax=Mycobacterium kansasii TaxID=1768 RepID=A0A1V3XEY3_MYCKA|nr:PPE36 domain protein [Mycobacterium kansasii]
MCPASNESGPGPALSSAECTSGGAAIHIGAVIVGCLRAHLVHRGNR